jgi:hypothetical protein
VRRHFDLELYLAQNRITLGVANRIVGTREYRAVEQFYGDRTTKRSGVPLMHHIDEGLAVLATIGARDVTMRAFCLHPLLQDDQQLVTKLQRLTELTDSVHVVAYAMEYRRIANAAPHTKPLATADEIPLSPLPEVQQMLVADKIQNCKDFIMHHRGSHRRSAELDHYFKLWFERLRVTAADFAELFAALQMVQQPVPLAEAMARSAGRSPQ